MKRPRPQPMQADYDAADLWKDYDPESKVCVYCQRALTYNAANRRELAGTDKTRDHLWPKYVRSMDAGRVGVVVCCRACNVTKSDLLPDAWRVHMLRHPEWWTTWRSNSRRRK